jgi:hypothetical protein
MNDVWRVRLRRVVVEDYETSVGCWLDEGFVYVPMSELCNDDEESGNAAGAEAESWAEDYANEPGDMTVGIWPGDVDEHVTPEFDLDSVDERYKTEQFKELYGKVATPWIAVESTLMAM